MVSCHTHEHRKQKVRKQVSATYELEYPRGCSQHDGNQTVQRAIYRRSRLYKLQSYQEVGMVCLLYT